MGLGNVEPMVVVGKDGVTAIVVRAEVTQQNSGCPSPEKAVRSMSSMVEGGGIEEMSWGMD